MFTKRERSRIMAAVKSRDTRPERIVEAQLRATGIRYSRGRTELPGTPDFVLKDYRIAVFVHGCFWHGHQNCAKGTTRPKSNSRFWVKKIEGNRRRDARVTRQLRKLGYSIYVVWECRVKSGRSAAVILRQFGLTTGAS